MEVYVEKGKVIEKVGSELDSLKELSDWISEHGDELLREMKVNMEVNKRVRECYENMIKYINGCEDNGLLDDLVSYGFVDEDDPKLRTIVGRGKRRNMGIIDDIMF